MGAGAGVEWALATLRELLKPGDVFTVMHGLGRQLQWQFKAKVGLGDVFMLKPKGARLDVKLSHEPVHRRVALNVSLFAVGEP